MLYSSNHSNMAEISLSQSSDLTQTALALPKHVAIITDGNRRWAKERGMPTLLGHREGAKRIEELARHSRDLGIATLTVWALSTENWLKRSKEEVSYLMEIIAEMVDKILVEAKKSNIRFVQLGRKDRLPKNLIDKVIHAEEETKGNTGSTFNIGLDYGGRDELLRAVNKARELEVDGPITAETFASLLDTGDQTYSDPDIIIRTGGEQRLSGYLPWQGDYAELFFEKTYLPDFTTEKFDDVLARFATRKRNFGA